MPINPTFVLNNLLDVIIKSRISGYTDKYMQ